MSEYPELHTIGHAVHSSSGDDGYGNPVDAWADAVDRSVNAIYPGTPGEDYEPGRNPSTIPMIVLGSTDQLGTVTYRDRIVWDGDTFEVEGNPESFDFGPFDFEPGIRIRMVRVEG